MPPPSTTNRSPFELKFNLPGPVNNAVDKLLEMAELTVIVPVTVWEVLDPEIIIL